MMQDYITIDDRYCGPPASGNGGYTVGRLASYFNFRAEVRLHYPPPLNTPLSLSHGKDDVSFDLHFGDTLVASVREKVLAIDPPRPPSFAEIDSVKANYIGFTHHNFPTCFVCGPKRAVGDGLRIFPAEVPSGKCVAALWQPSQNLADADGFVHPEYISAALDCPGFFAANTTKPALLGSMCLSIDKKLKWQDAVRVVGWCDHQEGRKIITGTAIYDRDDQVVGASSQIWIILK